jgi:hypothetical protein
VHASERISASGLEGVVLMVMGRLLWETTTLDMAAVAGRGGAVVGGKEYAVATDGKRC